MSDSAAFVITMCATVSLCSFISYSRIDGRITRLALGIILICSLIRPVQAIATVFDGQGGDITYEVGEGEEIREEALEAALRDGIKAAIAEEFSISSDMMSVEISGFNSEKMTCQLCRVRLYGTAALSDFRKIERFILECGAQKSEVIISL